MKARIEARKNVKTIGENTSKESRSPDLSNSLNDNMEENELEDQNVNLTDEAIKIEENYKDI